MSDLTNPRSHREPAARRSIRSVAFLAVSMLFLQSSAAFAQADAAAIKIPTSAALAETSQRIETLLTRYHQAGQFQGSALVSWRGEIVYRGAFGLANIEWDIPNTPETKHRVASHGKGFTAAIVMQLVDEGRIALDEPIGTYLPTLDNEIGERATIGRLLAHTSGVPRVLTEWETTNYRNPYTLDEIVEKVRGLALKAEPGERFSYSNVGYNLLGAMVERVTNKPYERVLTERILQPLQMNDTGLYRHAPILPGRAASYNRTFWGEFLNAPYMDESFAVGAGGVYSTVDDMFKFQEGLFGGALLSEESLAAVVRKGLGNSGYGFGVGAYSSGDGGPLNTLVYGMGGTNGAASVTFRLLEDEASIILLGNIRQIPQGNLASNVTNALVDVGLSPINVTRDAELYEMILSNDLDDAAKWYHEANEQSPGLPDVNRINQMGYELLEYDRLEHAIRVFRFNVTAHPEYANGYDSLGEAYVAADDREHAIDSYERALQLDASLSSTQAMLDRLREGEQ